MFDVIDQLFATHLAPDQEAAQKLFAFVLNKSRQGHLVIHQSELDLSCLSKDHIKEVDEFELEVTTPLCLYQDNVYLQKHWLYETRFLIHFHRLIESSLEIPFIEIPRWSLLLNPLQKKAAEIALFSPISIIAGGPGTGKTFTAVQLIETFWNGFPKHERCIIKVAAPTGKAATILEKNLRKRCDPSIEIEYGTLHFFLKKPKKILYADLFLVDEASMIDAKIFAEFLESMKGGGRIVLMGDPHQLPPIESGAFFSDLVSAGYGTVLQESLRTESNLLLDFAKAAFLGEINSILSSPFFKGNLSFNQIETNVIDDAVSFFSKIDPYRPQQALETTEKFKILSAIRKGPLGVDELNEKILISLLDSMSPESLVAIPILVTENDYDLGLMNGDTGVLIAKVQHLQEGVFSSQDQIYFPNKTLPASIIPRYDLGFVLSIHKSQGSEYDTALILLPPGSESFGRQMLYTAITRTKKSVSVFSNQEILENILKQPVIRSSSIITRLCNYLSKGKYV